MRRIVLMLVLAGTFLYASTLSDLMARYQRAPQSQRYKIMNQIKLEIARLNKKRQRAAIRQLRYLTKKVAKKDARRARKKSRKSRHRTSALDVIDGHTTVRTHTPSKRTKKVRDTTKQIRDTIPVPHPEPAVRDKPSSIVEKIPDMMPKMPKVF